MLIDLTNKQAGKPPRSYVRQSSQLMICSEIKKKPLVLPIKKKWFDMIQEGVKKEEYREIKPYWKRRFENAGLLIYDASDDMPEGKWSQTPFEVIFRNGYGNDKPEFHAEVTISEKTGRPEWGAEDGKKYYVLTIGRILKESCCDKRK